MPDKRWYYLNLGHQHGPLSKAILSHKLKSGELEQSTPVRGEAEKHFRNANTIPELNQVAAPLTYLPRSGRFWLSMLVCCAIVGPAIAAWIALGEIAKGMGAFGGPSGRSSGSSSLAIAPFRGKLEEVMWFNGTFWTVLTSACLATLIFVIWRPRITLRSTQSRGFDVVR